MKLLNFFDFEHFSQTGYPSIGLEYFTFENGPVPKKFWLEIKDASLPDDLRDKVVVNVREWGHSNKEMTFLAKANAQVDFAIFTPREKKILDKLAFIYKDATAKQMSQISHEDNMPWEITKREKGLNQIIDYLLAIDEHSEMGKEEAIESLKEHFAATKAFNIEPVK